MAAIFSSRPAYANIGRCFSVREKHQQVRSISLKINGRYRHQSRVESVSQTAESSASAATVNGGESGRRQNIPTKKQMADPHRQGLIVEGGVVYRQTVVIRSYEVGPDKSASLETILNLLQETALNHVWMSGLLGDGFGATHGMIRNNLIWVVSRMQVQIDYYPTWGEVVEIETWVGASGKNGMRRDWLIKSQATGLIFGRATSSLRVHMEKARERIQERCVKCANLFSQLTKSHFEKSMWVMMNRKTRRLSKMPQEVRDEVSPWFIEKQAIMEDDHEKILKLHKHPKYINTDLKPKRSDLDMNHHVNNVKYVRWMLETVPDQTLESYQLCGITLEYKRECGSSDIVQSVCEPEEDEELYEVVKQDYNNNTNSLFNGFSMAPEIINGGGVLDLQQRRTRFTHLLQIKGDKHNEEIVRGRTTWKRKLPTLVPFSS